MDDDHQSKSPAASRRLPLRYPDLYLGLAAQMEVGWTGRTAVALAATDEEAKRTPHHELSLKPTMEARSSGRAAARARQAREARRGDKRRSMEARDSPCSMWFSWTGQLCGVW